MIERFRIEKENMLLPQFQWTNTFPRCFVFSRTTFEEILADPGCKFIQIFPAMDIQNRVSFIVAGAATDDGLLAEEGRQRRDDDEGELRRLLRGADERAPRPV